MRRRPDARPTHIYWLFDGDVPFYCGKTILPPHQRLATHKYEAIHGTTRVNLKVRECADRVQIRIMMIVPARGDWGAFEKFWIKIVRQLNPNACNSSAGGQGAPGRIVSDEERQKTIERNKSRKWSDESRAKISAFMKGRKAPQAFLRLATARIGKKLSPEHCAAISQGRKGKRFKPHAPEHRAKISAGGKGKKRSAETIRRMSEGQKRANLARAGASHD